MCAKKAVLVVAKQLTFHVLTSVRVPIGRAAAADDGGGGGGSSCCVARHKA